MLYAEHNVSDIDLTRRHLTRYAPHIQLDVVPDARQILARLPEHAGEPTAYDVVLLDYRLPGTDALDVVKVLRVERGLDIPIVIVSGQGSEDVAAQAIHLGVDDYLSKHTGYLHELPATLEKVQRQVELTRERSNLLATSERLSQVLASSSVILYTLRLDEDGAVLTWVSGNIAHRFGYSEQEALAPNWWSAHVYADDLEAALKVTARLASTGHVEHDYRFIDKADRVHWIHDEMRLASRGEGVREVIGAWRAISPRRSWPSRCRKPASPPWTDWWKTVRCTGY